MNRKKHLLEQRGAKLKELTAMRDGAEKRAFTSEEAGKFDSLESEIKNIDAEVGREERAIALAAGNKDKDSEHQIDAALGLSEKEIRNYSLTSAIREYANTKTLTGLAAECNVAEARRLGRDPQGFYVPFEVLAAEKRGTSNNSVTPANDGGYMVGTSIDRANMVGLLRNQTHVLALGARVLTGLRDDVTIPRVTDGVTAYWVSEDGSIAASKSQFGQIAMKPRRLGATTAYTKQLLAQGSPDIDAFIKEDILAKFGVEIDRAAINGAGANEPLGILNLASGDRATSVTFGAAPTWAKVVSFETLVETANALGLPGGDYAYLTTPGVRGAWKTTAKITGQAQWLWENGNIVNGYAARSTNQVPSNKVIFGQFGQVLIGEWAGTDIVVDPYTLATTGQVKVTIQKLMDIVIRQGKAFSVSADAGNQ
jgi:HK97 family phage major capsid protein